MRQQTPDSVTGRNYVDPSPLSVLGMTNVDAVSSHISVMLGSFYPQWQPQAVLHRMDAVSMLCMTLIHSTRSVRHSVMLSFATSALIRALSTMGHFDGIVADLQHMSIGASQVLEIARHTGTSVLTSELSSVAQHLLMWFDVDHDLAVVLTCICSRLYMTDDVQVRRRCLFQVQDRLRVYTECVLSNLPYDGEYDPWLGGERQILSVSRSGQSIDGIMPVSRVARALQPAVLMTADPVGQGVVVTRSDGRAGKSVAEWWPMRGDAGVEFTSRALVSHRSLAEATLYVTERLSMISSTENLTPSQLTEPYSPTASHGVAEEPSRLSNSSEEDDDDSLWRDSDPFSYVC